MSEPNFGDGFRVVNWPEEFVAEMTNVVDAIQHSGNSAELLGCVKVLDETQSPSVPTGLLNMLARVLFDNPDTPIRDY